jgi:hypothetical protein
MDWIELPGLRPHTLALCLRRTALGDGHKVPPLWTFSFYRGLDHADFLELGAGFWKEDNNSPERHLDQKRINLSGLHLAGLLGLTAVPPPGWFWPVNLTSLFDMVKHGKCAGLMPQGGRGPEASILPASCIPSKNKNSSSPVPLGRKRSNQLFARLRFQDKPVQVEKGTTAAREFQVNVAGSNCSGE